ncbi:MAG TPA: glycosyltransferase family 2 protein [Rhodocyclaceae bacterium]|nr:glycosyltransferase family 2 protein [Rhodocyclaceae bacterium]
MAVIVTYRPELPGFFRLLDSLAAQVKAIVIVDNGSGAELSAAIQGRQQQAEVFLPLGENQGIAAAQNIGIARAHGLGATHVVLFDHDSHPAADMVARLLACLQRLESEGRRVASVGPCYSDERQDNPPPFIRVSGLSLKRCHRPEEGDAVAVDYLIASGCLIPMNVLADVGEMNADLFIDYVDIEWGQRARSRGYQNYGCFSARMQHALGDEPIYFLGRAYPARSPLRHYYMFRNAVHLYKMSHIPLDWRVVDAARLLPKFGFYVLFAPPRWQQFKMMSLGVLHGLVGRAGKL